MHLNSINHFRAVAIIFIVAGHCYGIAGLYVNTFIESVIVNIITGGTFLFVFVSGFLFHHVFYKKYQYKKFVSQKIKNILAPYLLLSALPVFFYVYKKPDLFDGFFLPAHDGIFNEYVLPSIKYYLTGAFLSAYWYIPFILVTFMLSPLHFLFIKAKISWQLGLTFVFCMVSLLMHRSVDNLQVTQSVVYFTSVYLIGILCSLYKDRVYRVLNGKEPILLMLIIYFAVLQALTGVVGNYHKLPFSYGGLDIMFIQKIIMCLFFMVYLHRFESYHSRYLQLLASTSFAIFFLHPIVIWWSIKLLHQIFLINEYAAFNSWGIYLLFVAGVTIVCIVIAKAVKKIMPKYSQRVIGY